MIKGNAVTGAGWGVARSCAPREHSGSTSSWEERVEAGKRLLIVDDEPDILHMLKEFFEMEGYATRCASSAEEALGIVNGCMERAGATDAFGGPPAGDRGEMEPIDLILLDVNMPGMDGFELCRHLRTCLSCPIIFLTARIEDVDQLDGFSAGADDYVPKPFSLEVLGGRVRAHLARDERLRGQRPRSVRVFPEVTIDYGERTVVVAATGAVLDLTRIEFDLVAFLSKNPGRVYDRSLLYERVWGWDATGDPSIVREHVRRIRRKLSDAGVQGELIETVWGVGYRWGVR